MQHEVFGGCTITLALSVFLNLKGHEVIHTTHLPDKNNTSDSKIRELADTSGMIVVTKDADFVSSHLLYGTPHKLLLLSTGNISNADLIKIIDSNLIALEAGLQDANFVELNQTKLIIHG